MFLLALFQYLFAEKFSRSLYESHQNLRRVVCEIVKMFNSFDGDFRRRPIVSIRGASKKESKAELLERAQRERSEREASY